MATVQLPAGWTEHLDHKRQEIFYYNKTTNVVTWSRSECFDKPGGELKAIRAMQAKSMPPRPPGSLSSARDYHEPTDEVLSASDPRLVCRSADAMTASQRARAERQRRRGGAYDDSQCIFDRLTDETLYTGSHVGRFHDRPIVPNPVNVDPNLGREHRKETPHGFVTEKTFLAHIKNWKDPQESAVAGLDGSGGKEKTGLDVAPINVDDPRLECRPKKTKVLNERQRKRKDAFVGRNIFDRLTDHTMYTGLHKHRFDKYGRGRGARGRDRVYKVNGIVGLRDPNLRYNGTTSNSSRPGDNRVFTCPSQFLVR